MMDAIEKCLDILDEESMKNLVQHLESAMKQAVGMPSKVSSLLTHLGGKWFQDRHQY